MSKKKLPLIRKPLNICLAGESCEEYMYRMVQLKKQDPDAYSSILKSEALHVLVH
jgi:hypothetical protein